jgi:hypothetical protein
MPRPVKRRSFVSRAEAPETNDPQEYICGNPECPKAGRCGGECYDNFMTQPHIK